MSSDALLPLPLPPLLRLLRPHQWAKNILLLLPLTLAHRLGETVLLLQAVLAAVAFSLMASAVYVGNDLLDVESDRLHPAKRHRPLASGAVPLRLAPWLMLGLASVALGLSAALLPSGFTFVLVIYLLANLVYSFRAKQIPVLDVVFLTLMYVLRIWAGGLACGVEVTDWLLTFSLFFFLSIALAKRAQELLLAGGGELTSDRQVRGYQTRDLPLVSQLGISAGLIAVLVLALYIYNSRMVQDYASPRLLWLLCPLTLYWLGRIWLLTLRGEMTEDPVLFTLRDRATYLILAAVGLVVQAAYWLRLPGG